MKAASAATSSASHCRFAIAPARSASNHALLWINPHTSSGVDNIDEYAETVTPSGEGFVYAHGGEQRAVHEREVVVRHKTVNGLSERAFTAYRTVHANSSNNTIFADALGNIAYLHSNFVPLRDARFDWTKPVDGSDPATDWQRLQTVDEAPNVINPKSGWLYNTNNAPWSAAATDSPKQADYPSYVDRNGDPRGLNAARLLAGRAAFTPADVVEAAFDPLTAQQRLDALAAVSDKLEADFGT